MGGLDFCRLFFTASFDDLFYKFLKFLFNHIAKASQSYINLYFSRKRRINIRNNTTISYIIAIT